MSKLEEDQGAVEIDEARLDDVSGGPIYMNYNDLSIKGDVTADGSVHTGGVNVLLGDGSVRFLTDSVDHRVLFFMGSYADGQVFTMP
jgi:prepilin-type processing-associated H-X9-DG protein